MFVTDPFEDTSYTLQRAIERHGQHMVVHSTSVKCRNVSEAIWDFCLPGVPFDVEWWAECKQKRIELQHKEDYSSDYTERMKSSVFAIKGIS